MYKKRVLALLLAALLIVSLVPAIASAESTIDEIAAKYEEWAYMSTDTEYLFANVIDAATFATISALPVEDLKADLAAAGYTEVAVTVTFDASFAASYDTSGLSDTEYGYLTSSYGFYAISVLKPVAAEEVAEEETAADDAETAEEAEAEVTAAEVLYAETADAYPTNNKLAINGEEVPVVAAYKIGGENYFKLRDIASLLGIFDVSYDDETNTIEIILGQAYTEDPGNPVSTEAPTENATAKLSKDVVTIDGEVLPLVAYKINGSNYFRLRSFEDAGLPVVIGYDDATKTATITVEASVADEAEEAEEADEADEADEAEDVEEAEEVEETEEAEASAIEEIVAKYEEWAYMSTDEEYLFANVIDFATFATISELPVEDLKADLAAAGYTEVAVTVTFDASLAASYDTSGLSDTEYGYLTSRFGFYAISVLK